MKLIDIYRYVEVPIFFFFSTAHIHQDARIWTFASYVHTVNPKPDKSV